MKNYMLWHPDSPGVRVFVRRPSLLRRLGINRSEFATTGEALSPHNSIWFFPITDRAPVADRDLTRPRD